MKQKKHRFLKHPILAAFLLPVIGLLGGGIIGQIVVLSLNGFDTKAAQNTLLSNDLPEIFLALLVILIMKHSYDNQFKFEYGFCFLGIFGPSLEYYSQPVFGHASGILLWPAISRYGRHCPGTL